MKETQGSNGYIEALASRGLESAVVGVIEAAARSGAKLEASASTPPMLAKPALT